MRACHLLRATRTIPIIFNNVADPVGAGYVDTMARPGGNATGFIQFEYSLSGKWPGLLKEIAPNVTRVAVLRDAALAAGIGQFAVIQSVAPSVGMEVSAIDVQDAAEIERAVTRFASAPNGRFNCDVERVSGGPCRPDHCTYSPPQTSLQSTTVASSSAAVA